MSDDALFVATWVQKLSAFQGFGAMLLDICLVRLHLIYLSPKSEFYRITVQ